MTAARRGVAAALAAALAVAVAACGGSSAEHAAGPTTPTTTAPGSTAPGSTGPGTTAPAAGASPPTTRLIPATAGSAPGPVVTVPTEAGTRPISEAFDVGQQVLITPTTFYPNILVATVQEPITWTNLTTEPQRLVFLQSTLQSPVINPGDKWSYTPESGANLHYRDDAFGTQGTVDFNPAP